MFPGDDTIDQIYHIVNTLGSFTDNLKDIFKRNKEFKNLKFPHETNPVTLKKRYGKYLDRPGLDLLQKLLEINEVNRISAEEALKHKFFEDVWDKQFYQADFT